MEYVDVDERALPVGAADCVFISADRVALATLLYTTTRLGSFCELMGDEFGTYSRVSIGGP